MPKKKIVFPRNNQIYTHWKHRTFCKQKERLFYTKDSYLPKVMTSKLD